MPLTHPEADWKPLYEAAILETDAGKLLERISAARNAILERIEETLRNPSPAEHRIMNDALRNLCRLAEMATDRSAA